MLDGVIIKFLRIFIITCHQPDITTVSPSTSDALLQPSVPDYKVILTEDGSNAG